MPIFWAVAMTRQAISPRLAIRILVNISISPAGADNQQSSSRGAQRRGDPDMDCFALLAMT
jgi:hypothetical protein